MKLPGKTKQRSQSRRSPEAGRRSPRKPSRRQKLTGSKNKLSDENVRMLLEQNGIDINDPEFQRYLVLTGRSLDDVVADLMAAGYG